MGKEVDRSATAKETQEYYIPSLKSFGTADTAKELANHETVNHPDHYQSRTGMETINVIQAYTEDLSGVVAFDIGNAIKYLCRWSHKNGVEDLKKAVWYINDVIKRMEE